MVLLRNALPTVCLALMVAVSVSAAPAVSHGHDTEMTPFQPSTPVVKIDRAMTQERQTLPDGTISVETTLDAPSAMTAKAEKSASPTAGKTKA